MPYPELHAQVGPEQVLILVIVLVQGPSYVFPGGGYDLHKAFGSGPGANPGVGPVRRRVLLRTFGSLERIRAASVEELASVPGIPRKVAEAIKEHL
ncbi:MAG TPA: hypothetical protein EYP77_10090 [Anaerolineae bacterium]|nr:hypothetical protein [Anaerolineae bacterium]